MEKTGADLIGMRVLKSLAKDASVLDKRVRGKKLTANDKKRLKDIDKIHREADRVVAALKRPAKKRK